MLAEWLQLISSTINWRLSWQRLWALSDTLLALLSLRISADFCASLLFHLKLHQNISSVIFNWTSLKIWAFVVFYEAKRCSSYLLRPHWQLVSFYDFLWSRALLQRLLALQQLDEHSSLGKEAVAKSPPTKSPSLLQVINAASNSALHHNFESKCWLKNFSHTPESASVYCQQVGTHPLQLTTQVFLAAVLTFFRIVSSLLQLRRINSTIEIWIMRCKYDLSTPFFQHIKRTSSRRQTPSYLNQNMFN